MNLKHGDIITLDNGDTVKVSLEVIAKAVTELVSGKKYLLKYTGRFCHARDSSGDIHSDEVGKFEWQYVGKVISSSGKRYIFFSKEGTMYSMWSTDDLKFVVREV